LHSLGALSSLHSLDAGPRVTLWSLRTLGAL
jgi:hypothetical protein